MLKFYVKDPAGGPSLNTPVPDDTIVGGALYSYTMAIPGTFSACDRIIVA